MNVCIQIQESSYFEKFPETSKIVQCFNPDNKNNIIPLYNLQSWHGIRNKDVLQDVKTKVRTIIIRGNAHALDAHNVHLFSAKLMLEFPKIIEWTTEEKGCLNSSCLTVQQFKAVLYHEPIMCLREITYLDCHVAHDNVGRMVGTKWEWMVRDLADEKWPLRSEEELKMVPTVNKQAREEYERMRESWLMRLLDTYGTQSLRKTLVVWPGMEIYAKKVDMK